MSASQRCTVLSDTPATSANRRSDNLFPRIRSLSDFVRNHQPITARIAVMIFAPAPSRPCGTVPAVSLAWRQEVGSAWIYRWSPTVRPIAPYVSEMSRATSNMSVMSVAMSDLSL